MKFIFESTQSSVLLKQHLEICEAISFPLKLVIHWLLNEFDHCVRHCLVQMLDLTLIDLMRVNLLYCKLVKIMES